MPGGRDDSKILGHRRRSAGKTPRIGCAVTEPLPIGCRGTWVRRQNNRGDYTVEHGYAINRDGTFGGLIDFEAQIFYGKVQYTF